MVIFNLTNKWNSKKKWGVRIGRFRSYYNSPNVTIKSVFGGLWRCNVIYFTQPPEKGEIERKSTRREQIGLKRSRNLNACSHRSSFARVHGKCTQQRGLTRIYKMRTRTNTTPKFVPTLTIKPPPYPQPFLCPTFSNDNPIIHVLRFEASNSLCLIIRRSFAIGLLKLFVLSQIFIWRFMLFK